LLDPQSSRKSWYSALLCSVIFRQIPSQRLAELAHLRRGAMMSKNPVILEEYSFTALSNVILHVQSRAMEYVEGHILRIPHLNRLQFKPQVEILSFSNQLIHTHESQSLLYHHRNHPQNQNLMCLEAQVMSTDHQQQEIWMTRSFLSSVGWLLVYLIVLL